MKIKIRVRTTNGRGGAIPLKELRKLQKLTLLRKKIEIEFIFDKFRPPKQ